MASKKIDWEATILKVLEQGQGADVHRVARAAGKREPAASDRRAIQRAFKVLIERGVLPPKGFTDLMLHRHQEFIHISQWMGHSSIERTWKNYKSRRLAHHSPDKSKKTD